MDTAQKIIALIMGISLSLSGCSAKMPEGYLKPGVGVSQIRSLAVLPFDNISGHPDAGKKVVNLLLTELTYTKLFEIAEMGEVEKSLRALRIRTTAEIDASKRLRLGEQLNVQAIIVGSVDEYELRQEKSNAVPAVAISARILDVQTGDILWAISHTHEGNDWETIFGFGKIVSLSRLAQIVISEMVESLVQELSVPQLKIAKLGQATAELGAEIEYVIEVQNVGVTDVTDVVITDAIPVEGMSFIRASEGGIPGKSKRSRKVKRPSAIGTVKWNVGNLAIDQKKTVSIILKTIQSGEWTNTARVTCDEEATALSSVMTTVIKPSLSLEKKATPASILLGKTMTFDITVSNTGRGRVTKVVILDKLPHGFKYKEATENGATDGNGNIRWQFDTLQPNETKTVRLTVEAIQSGEWMNTTQVTCDEGVSALSSVRTTVVIKPSLSLEKKATPVTISLGETTTFDISVSNTGRSQVTKVVILDKLPHGFKYKEATENGVTDGNGNIRWQFDTLQPNETKTVKLTVTGIRVGDYINEATVSSAEDATATGNIMVTILAKPAMQMTITDSADPVSVGGQTIYTIIVENRGAGVATDVIVVDNVPQEMNIVQAVASTGTRTLKLNDIQGNTIVFDIGKVQPGGKVTLIIKVKALEVGDVVNSVELTLCEFERPIIIEESTTIIKE